MPTRADRLATLEAVVTGDTGLVKKVDEIHADVKTLLAAHNRQSGALRLGKALWAALLVLAGAVGGAAATRHP